MAELGPPAARPAAAKSDEPTLSRRVSRADAAARAHRHGMVEGTAAGEKAAVCRTQGRLGVVDWGEQILLSERQRALRKSDAPTWAAVEWLHQGPDTIGVWRTSMERTLADRRCRFLCIFNWKGIESKPAAIEAIRALAANGR
ncbi:MAG: hypothetical protein Q7S40_04180 [Opitutaceae bacterium]|nr:hypothetical protein [Opitutaceae bacterium]